jgi:hypothetical protein
MKPFKPVGKFWAITNINKQPTVLKWHRLQNPKFFADVLTLVKMFNISVDLNLHEFSYLRKHFKLSEEKDQCTEILQVQTRLQLPQRLFSRLDAPKHHSDFLVSGCELISRFSNNGITKSQMIDLIALLAKITNCPI